MSAQATTRVIRLGLLSLLLASLAFGCVAAIVAIVIGGFESDVVITRVVLTPVTTVLYSCLAMVGTQLIQSRSLTTLAWMAILLLTAGMATWIWLIWNYEHVNAEHVARIAGTLTIPGAGIVIGAHLISLATDSVFLRVGAWVVAAMVHLLAIFGIVLIWTEWWYPYDDVVAGLLGLWIVVSLAGIGLLPTLIRSHAKRRGVAKESIPDRLHVEFTCPRCEEPQRLPAGLTRCGACRLPLLIEVEEPRCVCGYLLYRLVGDVCPECGLTVPEASLWTTRSP